MKALLGLTGDVTSTRVKALNGAASLAIDQGDHTDARNLLGESIRLSQELGYRRGEATALVYLGRSLIASGRPGEAGPYIERALQRLEGLDDPAALATALLYAGLAAHFTGQFEEACARYGRSADLCRAAGFRSVGARSLQQLGKSRLELGDIHGARSALEEALPTCLELGDRWVVPIVMAGFAAWASAPVGPGVPEAGGSGAGPLRGRSVQPAGSGGSGAGAVAEAREEAACLGGRADHGRGTADEPGRSSSTRWRTSPRRPGAAGRAGRSPGASWRWRPWSRRVSPIAGSPLGYACPCVRSTRTSTTSDQARFQHPHAAAAWAYESGLAPEET